MTAAKIEVFVRLQHENRVFQIALWRGEWGGFFLLGDGKLNRSNLDHSNLFLKLKVALCEY